MAAAIAGNQLVGGSVKQVTKLNFSASLQQIKAHIEDADFISVSCRRTGDSSASSSDHHLRHPWMRVLPIDNSETAYLKAKLAAETFELLQFAICPFRFEGSKVVAFPYNFHLFPRDEMGFGMPSYSFSCQTSYLTSMAREGFDFNACVYDGISFLSRVQESKMKERTPIPRISSNISARNSSVADSIFMGRIKTRVEHWRNACEDPGKTTDEPLVKSLRKLILGGEVYGSRPCMSIDICSDRQVQLVLEIVSRMCDDLVALVVQDKDGEPKAVRVVLTSSEEDKDLLLTEVQNLEEEQNLKVRGFREVIDKISNSQKPVVASNCLHDFTFIHSKFLSPLPPSPAEFMCSLRLVFPNIIDVNHLLKEVSPLRKAKNASAALSYLKRQFFVPIDMEIPRQAEEEAESYQGHRVLRLTYLFAKLGKLLKIVPGFGTPLESYTNTFTPCSSSHHGSDDEDVGYWMDDARRINTDNLVFLWGFSTEISPPELKCRLYNTHRAFTGDFGLRLVDKSCAVAVFCSADSAQAVIDGIGSGGIGTQGLKAAGYGVYQDACRLGLWVSDLADSLEKAMSKPTGGSSNDGSEVYWGSDSMIDLSHL